jgi:transcriptional regulator with GAF, ATPase, and Fis domain
MNPHTLVSSRPVVRVALEFASRPTNELVPLPVGTHLMGSSESCDVRVAAEGPPRVLATVDVLPCGSLCLRAESDESVVVNARQHRGGSVPAHAIVHIGAEVLVVHPLAPEEDVAIPAIAGLRGRSRPMRELARLVQLYAAMDVPVLIHGPSGTGKDAVAAALHRASRGTRPFVVANVAAIPRDICESELFGHARGAFTGADRDHEGLLMQADGGTLFLDEIGELPLDVQPKLLRALDGYGVRAVGGRSLLRPRVRIVTASHVDLREAVRDGRFRHDLLHRLEVLVVETPSLGLRSTDIVAIALGILDGEAARVRRAALTPRALLALTRMRWDGNVRELRNVLMRAAITARHARIEVDDLERACARTHPTPAHRIDGAAVLELLRKMGGNTSLAARAAQVPRTTFRRRVREALASEYARTTTKRRGTTRGSTLERALEVTRKPDDLLAAE